MPRAGTSRQSSSNAQVDRVGIDVAGPGCGGAGAIVFSQIDPALAVESSEWQEDSEERLHQALAGLDERSRDILAQRWLADDKATLHELAAQYQVSAERIRQLEQGAMKKLRAALAA